MSRNQSPRRRLNSALCCGLLAASAFAQSSELGGSIRLRHNTLLNADLNEDVDDGDNFTEMRTRLQFQRSVGERLRAFVQLQDSRVLGEEPSTVSSLDRVDLHQAYLEIQRALSESLSFKLGRMKLSYGAQRQLGALEWSNIARSFDGVFAGWASGQRGWLHGFAMQLTETSAGHTSDSGLFGAYAHYDVVEGFGLEAYLLDVYTDNGELPDGAGTLEAIGSVITAGLRGDWLAPSDAGWRLYAEAAYQTGATAEQLVDDVLVDGQDIAAYAAVGGVEFHLARGLRPWIGVEANYASGDDDVSDSDTKTYQQLFPTGHGVLGYADRVGWRNVRAVALSAGLAPNSQWEAWSSFHVFALDEAADRWYAASGAAVGALQGNSAFDAALGRELDLSLRYAPETALRLEAHLLFFWPGDWLEQASALAQNGGDVAAAIADAAPLDAATTLFLLTQFEF